MLLRVAHYRMSPLGADDVARRAQAMLGRISRADGLLWSSVGRRREGGAASIIAVSLWQDPESMLRHFGPDPHGQSERAAREGLPPPTKVELAEVVDTKVVKGLGLPYPVGTLEGVPVPRRRRLLPQDRALLRLLCGGETLAEAARQMGVSVGTAKNRRHEIYEKLGVHDLAHACLVAAPDLEPDTHAAEDRRAS